MTRRALVVACGLTALFAIGCGGITTPSNNQTETFSGTLQPRGQNNHVFIVSKSGEFTAKLTAWAPNSQLFAGMALTNASNDGGCLALLQQNAFVALNAQGLAGPLFTTGKYCIIVFDPSTLTAAQTYTITVSHP